MALNQPDESNTKRINIFTIAPQESQLKYSLTLENTLNSGAKVGEVYYNIKPRLGGTEGYCSMEEFGNQCGYTDEEIKTSSLVKINMLRIWKKADKVFALNPIEITKGNAYVNNIEITKVQPNDIFESAEIALWKKILSTINFEEVI